MQPDYRLAVEDLGSFIFNGKRFVVNSQPGVPRNAIIEVFDNYLRCWASRQLLTEEAANFVRENAVFDPKNNHFRWKVGVRVPEVRKG